jgi:hypothetical protein
MARAINVRKKAHVAHFESKEQDQQSVVLENSLSTYAPHHGTRASIGDCIDKNRSDSKN